MINPPQPTLHSWGVLMTEGMEDWGQTEDREIAVCSNAMGFVGSGRGGQHIPFTYCDMYL